MSSFDNKKLSSLTQTLNPKEAAKLVISYLLKEDEEKKDYENEIKTIVGSISPHKAREYNFYWTMYRNLDYYMLDFQTMYLELKLKDAYLSKIHYCLLIAPALDYVQRTLKRLPKPISFEEYQTKLKEEKEKRLQEVWSLDDLSKSEAYHSLVSQGEIDKDKYSEIESVIDAIKNIGKTHEELLENAYKSLGDFERKTLARKTGKKPEELSEQEVKKYIEQSLNLLEDATPQFKELWDSEVKVQRGKIEGLIKDGILKWSKYENKEGITMESIYKNIHLFSDKWLKQYVDDIENYELGEEDTDEVFRPYVGSVDFRHIRRDSKNKQSMYDMDTHFSINMLQNLQFLKCKHTKLTDFFHESNHELEFAQSSYKEVFIKLVSQIKDIIRSLNGYKEVIIRIERQYFDGMEAVSRKGLWSDVSETQKAIVQSHNQLLQNTLDSYSTFYHADGFKIENINLLQLENSKDFDEKWVGEALQKLVEFAEKDSGYKIQNQY